MMRNGLFCPLFSMRTSLKPSIDVFSNWCFFKLMSLSSSLYSSVELPTPRTSRLVLLQMDRLMRASSWRIRHRGRAISSAFSLFQHNGYNEWAFDDYESFTSSTVRADIWSAVFVFRARSPWSSFHVRSLCAWLCGCG